jgi:TPP-dependent pyruvate/acetoin dehydrogenase alpha subunit
MQAPRQLSLKRISRRPDGEDALRDAEILQRTLNRLRGPALIPRGLYRFSTHEEADEWMLREMARTHARLSSKTS